MVKSRYKLDLSGLHAQCEANYARLLRLYPDFDSVDTREFDLTANGESVRICMRVIERCKYTTMLAVTQHTHWINWLPTPEFEVRLYHDAAMAEVIGYRGHRKLLAKYEYPNRGMHHQDEKHQLNNFLGEWLAHCLKTGSSVEEVVLAE